MVKVIVPTLNASKDWPLFASALLTSFRPEQVLIVDSESNDTTVELARAAGFQVSIVKRAEFSHGSTRQTAAEMLSDAEILVYMTQDAVLANTQALDALLRPFEDDRVGAVYGRQLPREGAGHIEAHARVFNYPATSEVRSMENARHRGFKAIFFSNSFGAYRRKALEEVGGFPEDINFGEDTVVAGRLLLAGWKIAYAADAEVYHSHSYTIREEFQRYLRVGELHAAQPWMIEHFGGASGEGIRFVQSEFRYLACTAPHLIPAALVRAAGKIIGYKLGRKLFARS
jgi:rhamnosyltransferase